MEAPRSSGMEALGQAGWQGPQETQLAAWAAAPPIYWLGDSEMTWQESTPPEAQGRADAVETGEGGPGIQDQEAAWGSERHRKVCAVQTLSG